VQQQNRPSPSEPTAVDSDVSYDTDDTMPSTTGSSVDDGPDLSPGRPDADPNDPDGPDLVPSIPNDAGDGTDENVIRSDPATDPLHPFTLRTFGSSVLGGYSSCAEFSSDVESAVRHVANDVILANADGTYSRSRVHREGVDDDYNFDSQDADILEDLDARFGYGSRSKQEDGVDEIDVVKTDGRRHVYVAYGTKVLVWNQRQQREGRKGSLLSEIEVPRIMSDADEGDVDPWAPLPNVEGVMLPERDRLVVIVTGYGRSVVSFDDLNQPIISDAGATHALLYDVSDPSEPALIHRKPLDGTYIAARSVDSRVYIITSSAVQQFFHIVQYLERDRPRSYLSMSRTEYVAAATEVALQQLPGFVDRLVNEIISSGDKEDDCRNIVRMSLFQTGNDGDPVSASSHKTLSRGKGIIESLVRISSFDIEENNADDDHKLHQSMMFLPTHFADIFAANRVVVVPAQGYTYDRAANRWDQATMVVSFTIRNDGPASAMGVGQMLGHPINRYAMAENNDFLYVATRTRHSLVCNVTTASTTGQTATGNSCKEWVRVAQAEEHIELLEFPPDSATNAVLERTGWISDFGDMEQMYSVRFIGPTAFISTVNQTGPFFTADLSNVTDPYLVGTLNLPALSNQLHSISQEGQVLAVGEDVDESTGLPVGVRLSYFDLRDDISNPREIHSLVESMSDGQRDAQVQYDYRNSIYLDDLGLVLLPTAITSYAAEGGGEFFKGFRVYEFDVDNGVGYKFNISHSDDSSDVWSGCFSDARVPARAISDTADKGGGDLFTVNMHSAIMVDTSAKDTVWSIEFDAKRREEEMCYSY